MAEKHITLLRQVDFYRERATMCASDIIAAAEQVDYLLRLMFGTAATKNITPQQVIGTAATLRQRMRRCTLLLMKKELMNSVEDTIYDMTTEELDALPPLPKDTIFGFESPTIFDLPPQPGTEHFGCTEDECEHEIKGMLMSIIIPTHSSELLFDDEESMEAFAGYSRLADQLAVYGDEPEADVAKAVQRLQRLRQAWIPTMFYPMDQELSSQVSMRHMLKLALHRATRPTNTTPPKDAQHDAKEAQVRPKAARAVRTVELAPRYRTTTTTGTGQPLRWRSQTIGHWRHYRNPDGSVREKVWIPSYTRGKEKPPRPTSDKPGVVKVAREPKPATDENHQQ